MNKKISSYMFCWVLLLTLITSSSLFAASKTVTYNDSNNQITQPKNTLVVPQNTTFTGTTNRITGNLGVDGTLGMSNLTATTAYWINLISMSQSNGYAYFRTDGTMIATNDAIGLTNLPASGGGGGTNSGPITLTFSDTNVAVVASTPLGCVTNGLLPYRLTMTTNAMIANPTGMADGQRITIEFIQDATGSRLAYFGNAFAFGTDITGITLTTTAAKRDYATFVYSNSKWNCLGFTRGY